MSKCEFCSEILPARRKYCSVVCQKQSEYADYITRWKNGAVDGGRGKSTRNLSGHLIKYIKEKYQHRCARCGWNEINPSTGKSPLDIEHIDGNSENNAEDNLILLCPNCHAVTATYKNLNKGRGRSWRIRGIMLQ